jgi:hypothetical protein
MAYYMCVLLYNTANQIYILMLHSFYNWVKISTNVFIRCFVTLRFSWQWVWRWLSSGLWRCLDWYESTTVSEVCTASIIRVMSEPCMRKGWSKSDRQRPPSSFPIGSLALASSWPSPQARPSSTCQTCFLISTDFLCVAHSSPEMLVNSYQSTQCYNLEDSHLQAVF